MSPDRLFYDFFSHEVMIDIKTLTIFYCESTVSNENIIDTLNYNFVKKYNRRTIYLDSF